MSNKAYPDALYTVTMKILSSLLIVLGLLSPAFAFAATDVVEIQMARQAPRSSMTSNFRTVLGTLRFERKRTTDMRTLYVVIEGEAQKAFFDGQGMLSKLLTQVELRNVGTKRTIPAILKEESHTGKKTRAVYMINDFIAENADSWEIRVHTANPFGLRTLRAAACGQSSGPMVPCVSDGSDALKSTAQDLMTGNDVLLSPGVVQFGTVIMRGK